MKPCERSRRPSCGEIVFFGEVIFGTIDSLKVLFVVVIVIVGMQRVVGVEEEIGEP